MYLTKTRFLVGVQCPLRLWYHVHRKDLIPQIDKGSQHRLETGREVGKLARGLFPGGWEITIDHSSLPEAADQTAKLMANPKTKTIYEATFISGKLAARVDILNRTKRDRWQPVEVKSGTKVKRPEHIADVWFQSHVMTRGRLKAFFPVLLHLNRDYCYDGQSLDVAGLFQMEEVVEDIEGLDLILTGQPEALLRTLQSESAPEVKMTKECPKCELFDHCREKLPKQWIYFLPRLSAKKRDELTERGIDDICNVPDDFKLTAPQAIVRSSAISGKEYIGSGLKKALNSATYPLYFLDFESISEAIPRYQGNKPYDQIPFQWSCHVLEADGSLSHYEFLHGEDSDPRRDLLESLLECLQGTGSIIHFSSFEKTVLSALAVFDPSRVRALTLCIERLSDLCQLIKRNYYHPDFVGSYRIKRILPVLVPSLTYDDLDIGEGTAAQAEYLRMIDSTTPEKEQQSIRKALLQYCGQDTLAMVKIWQVLEAKSLLTPVSST